MGSWKGAVTGSTLAIIEGRALVAPTPVRLAGTRRIGNRIVGATGCIVFASGRAGIGRIGVVELHLVAVRNG